MTQEEKQWKPVPKVKPTGVLKELLDNIDEKELEETRKEMMEEAEKEESVSKDLEEKAKQLGQKYFPDSENIWARPNYEAKSVEMACIEMAQWQKQQMMKEVYTGTYDCDDDTSWIGFKGWLLSTSKVGNKVKLIIIKEE